MKRIAKILSIINKLDEGGLYKQSDIIEKALIVKIASDMAWGDYNEEDWGDVNDYNPFEKYDPKEDYYNSDQLDEIERNENLHTLFDLLYKDNKTLDDREQIAYLISILGGKPYEPDPETMRLQEILGDENLYPATYEDVH